MRRAALLAATITLLAGAGPRLAAGAEPRVEGLRLENGLAVMLRPIAGAKATSIVTVFRIGGVSDPPDACGTAHLIEHLWVTSAAGKIPARTYETWAVAHPLGSNAQTGDDVTIVGTVFEPSALAAEIEDVAARMAGLAPTEADLARELPRVRLELENMYGGMPGLAAVNLAKEQVRSTFCACPRPGGDADALSKVPLANLRARIADHYKPGNAVVAVAGAFDAAIAKDLVTKAFASIPGGRDAPGRLGRVVHPDLGSPGRPAPPPPPRVTPFEVRSSTPGEPRRIATVAWPLQPLAHREHRVAAARLVLVTRLWTRMGREFGLATSFPPPILWAPNDGADDLVLGRSLREDEDPEEAVDELLEFVRGAAAGKPSKEDVTAGTMVLERVLGWADAPDAAVAENPYGVALGLAQRGRMRIDGAGIRAALSSVTEADLGRAADGFPTGPASAVVVIPKPPK